MDNWEEKRREFEEEAERIASEVTAEYEARLRDELELANARESALAAERIAARPDAEPPPPLKPGELPAGPAEKRYQRIMKGMSMGPGRNIGRGASLAFIFISYPIGGALLGWILDHWFFVARTGQSAVWPILVCTILGFYNGVIELLRQSRKLEQEAAQAREEQKRRTR